MGCNASYHKAQKELYCLRELQTQADESQQTLADVKKAAQEKMAKVQADHFAEIKELHDKIARMVEATSEEQRRVEEEHTRALFELQEHHTEELRKVQVEHHNHMSQELVRHMEEVRRLQAEYHAQLKNMGVDMRKTALSVAEASKWCVFSEKGTKEVIYSTKDRGERPGAFEDPDSIKKQSSL